MSSSFSIRPAQVSDVPAMARLGTEAFRLDRNTQVKAMGADPYDHEATMNELLPGWIARAPEKGFTVVAADDASGEILGWVCWGIATGCSAPSPTPTDHDAKEREARAEPDPVARLGRLTSVNMRRWMDILMPPGTACMFFMSIAVHPAHQGRGVGSALVRTGTERADQDGLFIWMHASEAGALMVQKHGFEVVGEYDVDLDEFAIAPPPLPELARGEGKWGHYTFKYMK
ncbi:acyl-CoA N-acyltransferase, partial [Exidia glandulosa HHB12029]